MVRDILVRKAEDSDAQGVCDCLRLAFEPYRDKYTPDAFHDTVPNIEAVRNRIRTMTVYVAVLPDGSVVGSVAETVHGNEGHLRGMAVLPAWQGHEIGDKLLGIVEDDLAMAGCCRITLDTTEPLERAIGFYLGKGFKASGKVTGFFGMPLYEYAKPLPPQNMGTDGPDTNPS